jgi:cephalosporin hydroxylase
MSMMERVKRELRSLRSALRYRLFFDSASAQVIIERFHRLYFDSHVSGKTWMSSFWMGVPVRKCPTDLWKYQEMIYELRPDVIIETGTQLGGSAYYLASLCDLVGNGRVVTIDIDGLEESLSKEKKAISKARPSHPRILYCRGSSTSEDVTRRVKELIQPGERVLVILDSDHRKAHVLDELRTYAPMVPVGSYIVVEDTCVNGHPILSDFGPGPREAVEDFLSENNDDFVVDRSRESHLITFNPGGFLRRVR